MEIVSFPDILFLDEPTSGLDSTASLDVLSSLKDFSRLGVTVIAVIHQPRYTLFRLFDEVLLLGVGGKTVYQGSTGAAMEYFSKNGFICPNLENPADFFLDKGNPNFKLDDLFDLSKEKFIARVHVYDDNLEEEASLTAFFGHKIQLSNVCSSKDPNTQVNEKRASLLLSASGKFADVLETKHVTIQTDKDEEEDEDAQNHLRQTRKERDALRKIASGKSQSVMNVLKRMSTPFFRASLFGSVDLSNERMVIDAPVEEEKIHNFEPQFAGMLPNHVEMLRIVFQKYHNDDSDSLTPSNLKKMFEEFGQPLTDSEISQLFHALGIEEGGSLTFEIFQQKLDSSTTSSFQNQASAPFTYSLSMGGFFIGLNPALNTLGKVMKGITALSYSRYAIEALCVSQAEIIPSNQVSLMFYQGYDQSPSPTTNVISC